MRAYRERKEMVQGMEERKISELVLENTVEIW